MNDLLKSPHGEEVKEKYLVVTRALSFIENCNKSLNQFVSQIHKSSKMVEEIVVDIEDTLLIKIEDFGGGVCRDRSRGILRTG